MKLRIGVVYRTQSSLVSIAHVSFFMNVTPSSPSRSKDDIVIVATGSFGPTGRNSEEAHRSAIDFRTGIRELTSADIVNFELMCVAKGLTRDKEKQEFFRCLWGDKCGVGGVIPREYFPSRESGYYPTGFFRRGEQQVGTPIVQAYIAFRQIRDMLPQLFGNDGRVLKEHAPETMIDIANGAGSSTEMVESALMELLKASVNERLGMQYGGKWLLGMLGSMISGQIAAEAGIEGAQNSSNSACASSGLSMFNAWNAIRAGSADIGIVGGSEYATGPCSTYVSFDHMMYKSGALSRKWRENGKASEALRAFDAVRDGFVPGDAAVLIVLMRRRIAGLLQIEPLARVLGVVANTCQPVQYGKSLADGTITGQAALLERLLQKSGIDQKNLPGKLVHFLHGTGTKVGDMNEVYAAAKAVGDIARDGRYVVTSEKPLKGHTLGAAFAGNVSAAIEAIRHCIVPGLPSTHEVDPKLRTVDPEVAGREGLHIDSETLGAIADSILCRRHAPLEPDRDIIIADAKGFGGTNAAVALKAEL